VEFNEAPGIREGCLKRWVFGFGAMAASPRHFVVLVQKSLLGPWFLDFIVI
jgi:hypothetical protein